MATWQLKTSEPVESQKVADKDKQVELTSQVEQKETTYVSKLDSEIKNLQDYIDTTTAKVDILTTKRAKIIADLGFTIE